MRAADQRGAAGILITTGICLAVLAVTMTSSIFINWFALARQAEQAAELAALAATSASVEGRAPCSAARTAARQNQADVARCDVRGAGRYVVVEVTVEVTLVPSWPSGPERLQRVATAGT